MRPLVSTFKSEFLDQVAGDDGAFAIRKLGNCPSGVIISVELLATTRKFAEFQSGRFGHSDRLYA